MAIAKIGVQRTSPLLPASRQMTLTIASWPNCVGDHALCGKMSNGTENATVGVKGT